MRWTTTEILFLAVPLYLLGFAMGMGVVTWWVGRDPRKPREPFFLPNPGGRYGTSPIGKVGDIPPRPTPPPPPARGGTGRIPPDLWDFDPVQRRPIRTEIDPALSPPAIFPIREALTGPIPGRPGQEVDSAGGALPRLPRLRPAAPDYTYRPALTEPDKE